jgi:hypothetical protein
MAVNINIPKPVIDYNDLDNKPNLVTEHSELILDDGTNPHGTTASDVGALPMPNGTTSQYLRGDGSLETFPTIPNPANFVAKADFTSHSILAKQSGGSDPVAVSIGTNEILGRKSGGGSNIEGLSVSEVKSLLNYTASDVGAPSGSGTSTGTNTGDQTFLNARVQTVASSATVTATSTNDIVTITAQSEGLTLANPTGIFTEGQSLIFRIKDNGTARTIGYGANFRAIGVTAPTTTVANKTTYIGCIYNSTDTKFDIIGLCTEA